jgi:hypothetical protein
MGNIPLLIFDIISLPITMIRVILIYIWGSKYEIQGFRFLDVIMHANNPYFNQEDCRIVNTIGDDFRIVIRDDSRLYPYDINNISRIVGRSTGRSKNDQKDMNLYEESTSDSEQNSNQSDESDESYGSDELDESGESYESGESDESDESDESNESDESDEPDPYEETEMEETILINKVPSTQNKKNRKSRKRTIKNKEKMCIPSISTENDEKGVNYFGIEVNDNKIKKNNLDIADSAVLEIYSAFEI